MINAKLTCGCGRGPTPGTRVDFVRIASALAAAHQFRGKKREREEKNRPWTPLSLSRSLPPSSPCGLLVSGYLLSPRTAPVRDSESGDVFPCARTPSRFLLRHHTVGKKEHANSYTHPATCLETTQHPSTLSSAVDGKLTTVVTVM